MQEEEVPVLLNCYEASLVLKDFKVCPQTIKRWAAQQHIKVAAYYSHKKQPLFAERTILAIKKQFEEEDKEYELSRAK